MEQIGQTAACACAVGISLAVAEHLLPSAAFHKQLRLMFSLILILGLCLPFVKNLSALPDAAAAAQAQPPTDAAFQSIVAEETETQLCRTLSKALEENGVVVYGIETDVHISEDGRITISEVRLSCSDSPAAQNTLIALLGEESVLRITEGSE